MALRSGHLSIAGGAGDSYIHHGGKPAPVEAQLYGQPMQFTTTTSTSNLGSRRPGSLQDVLSGVMHGSLIQTLSQDQAGPAFMPLFSPVEADEAKVHDIQASLRHVSASGPSLESDGLPMGLSVPSALSGDTKAWGIAGQERMARRKSQDAACQTEPELFGAAPGPTSRRQGTSKPLASRVSSGMSVSPGLPSAFAQQVNSPQLLSFEKGRQSFAIPPGRTEGYEGMSERLPADDGLTPLLAAQDSLGGTDGKEALADIRPVSLGEELSATLAELEEAFGIHAVGAVQVALPRTLGPSDEGDGQHDPLQGSYLDDSDSASSKEDEGGLDAYARAVEAQADSSQHSSSRSNEAIPDESMWAAALSPSPSILLRHDLAPTPHARGAGGLTEGMQAMPTVAAGSPARINLAGSAGRVNSGTVSLGFDTEGLDAGVIVRDESPLRAPRYAPLPRSPAGRSPSKQLRAQAHAGQAALSAGRRRAAASSAPSVAVAAGGDDSEHLPTGQPTSELEGSLMEPGFPITAMPTPGVTSAAPSSTGSPVRGGSSAGYYTGSVSAAAQRDGQSPSRASLQTDTPLPERLAQL